MLPLIWKDLYLQRRNILTMAGLGLIFIAAFSRIPQGIGVYGAWTTMLTFSYVMRTAYDEDQNRSFVFLRSLPLPPDFVVWSKFISTFVVSVLAAGYVLLIYRGLGVLGFTPVGEFDLILALTMVSLGLAIAGVFLAAFFKWNYSLASRSVMFVFAVPFLLPMLLPKTMRSVAATLDGLAAALDIPGPLAFAPFGMMVYLAALAFSLCAFSRKEVG